MRLGVADEAVLGPAQIVLNGVSIDMNTVRDRVRADFPMVLLTLLSIVQALALDLLWPQIGDAAFLFRRAAVAVYATAGAWTGTVLRMPGGDDEDRDAPTGDLRSQPA